MLKISYIAPIDGPEFRVVTTWEIDHEPDWGGFGREEPKANVTSIFSPELDRAWTLKEFFTEFGPEATAYAIDCSREMTEAEQAEYAAECLAAKKAWQVCDQSPAPGESGIFQKEIHEVGKPSPE